MDNRRVIHRAKTDGVVCATMAPAPAAVDASSTPKGIGMPGYDVTPAELRSSRTFVDGVAHDVLAEVSKVSHEVDALLDSGWTGASARAFASGWTEWKAGARNTLRALDTMAELLGVVGRDYADAEVFVVDRFAKFAY